MIVLDNGDIRFSSGHDALIFAFNVSDQAYDRPMMNRLAAPSIGKGGLAGLEAPAQAGMIRAEVQTLGKLAEAIIIARIAPRSVPCHCRSACCAGHKQNKEWTNAIAWLCDHVRTTALAGCTANGLMRREYVVRYFTPKDRRDSLEMIADRHEIARNTASAHAAKVALFFAGSQARKDKPGSIGMEQAAFDAIQDRLRDVGVVM